MKSNFLSVLLWSTLSIYSIGIKAQFSKVYSLAPNQEFNPRISNFNPKQVMVINAGDCHFMVGSYSLIDSTSKIFIMKTDLSGNVVWSKEYGKAGYSESAKTLEVSHDSTSLVVVGKSSLNTARVLVFKILKSNGDVVWSKNYSGIDELSAIVKKSMEGNQYYLLCGRLKVFYTQTGDSLFKPVVIALNDLDGSIKWSKYYYENPLINRTRFNYGLTGFTLWDSGLAFTGNYYNKTRQRSSVYVLRISPFTGKVCMNSMRAYDLEHDPNDSAIVKDPKYVWKIERLYDPEKGAFVGHAITGTYIKSPTATQTSSEIAVLRIDSSSAPSWAKLYVSPHSAKSYGRGIFQSQQSNTKKRLDVFTTHDQYQGGSNRVNGLLGVNMTNGNIIGFQIQTLNTALAGFLGASMNRRDSTGYLFLSENTENALPKDDAFQLIGVDGSGSSNTCQETSIIDAVSLNVSHSIIELAQDSISIQIFDNPITSKDIVINSKTCSDLIDSSNLLLQQMNTNIQPNLASENKSQMTFKKSEVLNSSIKNGRIGLFPNPTHNMLYVQFNSLPPGNYQITLINMEGKLMLQKNSVYNNGSSCINIDMSFTIPGVYLLTVRQGQLVLQQKVLKR